MDIQNEEIKRYILGEDPKITTIVNDTNPDSVTITIKDPSNATLVDEANMTLVTSEVYQYIFSTTTSYLEGIYEATVTVTSGGNEDKDRIKFEMYT